MKNPIRLARALSSAVRLVRDPSRLDEVFQMADSLVDPKVLQAMAAAVAEDPAGALALDERPRIGRLDLDAFRGLPAGTLGRAFAEHMDTAGLDPAALPRLPADDPLTFLRAHLYETHDVWHVVTGFETDVAGELGLQAFYVAQVPGKLAPALVAGGLLNAVLYQWDQRDARMRAIVRGWLLGKRAKPLFGARWAEMWSVPLTEVRARFAIDVAGVEEALPAAA
jgi:ubiquinone biosynthesis protein COQ4